MSPQDELVASRRNLSGSAGRRARAADVLYDRQGLRPKCFAAGLSRDRESRKEEKSII